jgi:hypothetical protein
VQRLIAAAAIAGTLVACASAPPRPAPRETPQLRLAPALLGHPLNLLQHLWLQAPGRDQQLDVLLEADAQHVQLGIVAMGQVAARLAWDGSTLTEERAPWLPQAVSGARILSDLQLTLWPAAAIRAALPPGWTLAESGDVRTLSQDGEVVTVITHVAPSVVELDQRREHFKLKIESRAPDGAAS